MVFSPCFFFTSTRATVQSLSLPRSLVAKLQATTVLRTNWATQWTRTEAVCINLAIFKLKSQHKICARIFHRWTAFTKLPADNHGLCGTINKNYIISIRYWLHRSLSLTLFHSFSVCWFCMRGFIYYINTVDLTVRKKSCFIGCHIVGFLQSKCIYVKLDIFSLGFHACWTKSSS